MRRFCEVGLLCLTLLTASLAACADVWTAPASALAQRIVTKSGTASVALTVKNISSLSASDANAIRTQLMSELRSRGVRVVNAQQAASEVQVTLSENVAGLLWIAEIKQASGTETVFTTVPRMIAAASASTAMTLQRRLLWAQDEPILDLALLATQPGAIVLTPTKVAYYRIQNGVWQESDAAVITHTRPLPRDLRGMILNAGASPFDVALPGTKCTVSGSNPYNITCGDTDDPWPIYEGQPRLDAFFSPARNFFTGAMSRSGESVTVPQFYSTATFGNNEWLFAGTDRRVQYSNFANTTPLAVTNWGSELASIRGKCSPDAVVLATRNGDYTQTDAVQGYQIVGREPVAVTGALEFAGPVTSLRGSGETAVTVTRNLKTGKYEAYSLTLACNQ